MLLVQWCTEGGGGDGVPGLGIYICGGHTVQRVIFKDKYGGHPNQGDNPRHHQISSRHCLHPMTGNVHHLLHPERISYDVISLFFFKLLTTAMFLSDAVNLYTCKLCR